MLQCVFGSYNLCGSTNMATTTTYGVFANVTNIFVGSTPGGNGSAALDKVGNCLTSYCIPMTIAISVIAVCGIAANGIVLTIVAQNSRLHRPTFTAIAALALADFLFLAFRYTRHILQGYFRNIITSEAMKVIKFVCDLGGLTAGGSSIIHVILLSLLRYYIVVHPLKSHIVVTNRKILLVSLAVWVFSAFNGWFYLYAVLINRKNDLQMSKITNVTVTLVMSIAPLIIIVFFHVLKARKLSQSIAACKLHATKRMSQIVTFVIVSYVVTTTPANVRDVILISWGPSKDTWMAVYGLVGRLLLFTNYAINPFIYFVHSPQFKKYINCCRGARAMHYVSTNRTLTSMSSMSHTTEVDLPSSQNTTHLCSVVLDPSVPSQNTTHM